MSIESKQPLESQLNQNLWSDVSDTEAEMVGGGLDLGGLMGSSGGGLPIPGAQILGPLVQQGTAIGLGYAQSGAQMGVELGQAGAQAGIGAGLGIADQMYGQFGSLGSPGLSSILGGLSGSSIPGLGMF